VGSQAFFSFMDLFVKVLSGLDQPVPALELIWIRMTITYVCCISYMLLKGVEHPWTGPSGVRLLLVSRGVCGFFGLFGIYYSLQYLTLSEATVLMFLTPTLTGVVSYFLLKEHFSRKQSMAGLCSLIGVVLIARPASLFGEHSGESSNAPGITSSQRFIAVGVSLVGVVGAAGAYTSMRAIGKNAHSMHSMAYFSLYSFVVSSVLMVIQRTEIVIPTDWHFLVFLCLIGFFGFIGQTLLVLGFQFETASRGSMAIYTLILFSGTWEQIFLHVKLAVLSVVGAVIIISSAIYIAVTKPPSDDKPASKQVRWVEDLEAHELLSDHTGYEELRSPSERQHLQSSFARSIKPSNGS